jgi:Ca-activated chloride channel family protein
MELDLDQAADAAIDFVDTLDEARDVTLVEFDAGVRIGRFVPSNYLRLFERIRDPTLGARTVLYDAIAHYLDTTLTRQGQHVLVVYTDGGDSGSGLNVDEVIRLLRFGNVVLYAVGYLDHQSSSAQVRQRALLSALARDTGGEAFFPASGSSVERIYQRIRREIESRYTLGYVPAMAGEPGEFRAVTVRLSGPEHRDLRIRTRAGYIALGQRPSRPGPPVPEP